MLTLSYHGHTLIGIPAIHYRAVFAEMVNRSCARDGLRPDAIAVELEPAATLAIIGWLKELGMGSGRAALPCMLGLTRQNRRIHPRFKEAALQLQAATGQQLHELPPEVLYRELGYAALTLLCLSPTDSIIEAIRCAVELNVPVYGIDLDHSPSHNSRVPLNLRDPITARGNLDDYVAQHESQTEQARDEYGDTRREIVMAARLKTLLIKHERVLFTCGLAHWTRICRLLADESLQPAQDVPQNGESSWQRVLVHPEQAIQQMDIFPGITAAYEAARQPATRPNQMSEVVDFQEQFRTRLEMACSRYYSSGNPDSGKSPSSQSSHGVFRFTGYLLDLCLLSQRITPDLSTTLKASRSLLPCDFVQIMTDTMMEFDWATPSSYPELPIISPDPKNNSRGGGEVERAVMKIPHKRSLMELPTYQNSEPFHVDPLHENASQGETKLRFKWKDEPMVNTEHKSDYSYDFIWPPCEYLFYGSIYAAINAADALCAQQRTESFADSLYDGIDLKASLRSALRGDKRLFVRRSLKATVRPVNGEPIPPTYSPQLELQPTVFIFSREATTKNRSWKCLMCGDSSLYHDLSERGKKLFNMVTTNANSLLIESFHFLEDQPVSNNMKPWVTGLYQLQGSVRFGNPCINFYQSSKWLEKGRFKSDPIMPYPFDIDRIAKAYRDQHHIAIDLEDWQNALILFALPYAITTHRVVVVAPKGFRPSEAVQREARRRRITLVTLPLTYFPTERISQIRQQYCVKASHGGKEYPPELERIFGHRPSHYQELLPRQIVAQCVPNTLRRPQTAVTL